MNFITIMLTKLTTVFRKESFHLSQKMEQNHKEGKIQLDISYVITLGLSFFMAFVAYGLVYLIANDIASDFAMGIGEAAGLLIGIVTMIILSKIRMFVSFLDEKGKILL